MTWWRVAGKSNRLVRERLLDAWSGPRMVARRAAPLEAGELLAVPDLLHRDAVDALALRTWRRYVVREIGSVRGVHRPTASAKCAAADKHDRTFIMLMRRAHHSAATRRTGARDLAAAVALKALSRSLRIVSRRSLDDAYGRPAFLVGDGPEGVAMPAEMVGDVARP